MDSSIKPENSQLPKFLAIPVVSLLLLGSVSSFALVGFNFIPSAEWMAETNLLRIFAGFLYAALLAWVVWRGGKQMSELKRIIAVAVSPFAGYFMGSSLLFIWPLLLPLIAGHEVALPFTVLRATDLGGVKNCHSPVILENMPFLIGRVCHVPESIRSSLSPGRRIVVRGWGTPLGVYASDLSLADLKGPRL
jgi:hypothetical protein